MSQDKIMIVDNEMEIIQLMRLYLSREGYNVVWTTDSTKAISLLQEESPDLILLDVVMPGLSGINLCGQIRNFSSAPIIFVSCKSDEMDKVLGLSIGGDDYITKPFSPAELVARVKAHLRRKNLSEVSGKPPESSQQVSYGALSIDLDAHSVFLAGNQVHLTAKEFELFTLLCKYPNRVFTLKQIFDNLWDSYGIDDDYRTVNVHIYNIRKKIESDPDQPKYIQTVRGVGYKFIGLQKT